MLYFHSLLWITTIIPGTFNNAGMMAWYQDPELLKVYSTKRTLQGKTQMSFASISYSKLWQGWLGWICFSTATGLGKRAKKALSDTARETSGKGNTTRKPGTPGYIIRVSVTHFSSTSSTAGQRADLQVLVELETCLCWHSVVKTLSGALRHFESLPSCHYHDINTFR